MKRIVLAVLMFVVVPVLAQIKTSPDFNRYYNFKKVVGVDSSYYPGVDTVVYAGKDTVSTKPAYFVGFTTSRIPAADTVIILNGADTVLIQPLATTQVGQGFGFGAICDTNLIVVKKTSAFVNVIWRKQ